MVFFITTYQANSNFSVNAISSFFLIVSGPRSLANDTRKAVNSPRLMDVLRGGPTITFYAEAFGSVRS